MIFIKKIVIFSLFASNHVKQNAFTIFLDSRVVVLWLPTWELGPWNHPHRNHPMGNVRSSVSFV